MCVCLLFLYVFDVLVCLCVYRYVCVCFGWQKSIESSHELESFVYTLLNLDMGYPTNQQKINYIEQLWTIQKKTYYKTYNTKITHFITWILYKIVLHKKNYLFHVFAKTSILTLARDTKQLRTHQILKQQNSPHVTWHT